MKATLFSILIIAIFTSCSLDQWYGIKITNNSNNSIHAYGVYILPDTALAQDKPILNIIGEHKTAHIFGYNIGDEKLTRFEKDKVTIFILSREIVEKNTWEDIRTNYRILKRYEINKQDLINMGGVVTYP